MLLRRKSKLPYSERLSGPFLFEGGGLSKTGPVCLGAGRPQDVEISVSYVNCFRVDVCFTFPLSVIGKTPSAPFAFILHSLP